MYRILFFFLLPFLSISSVSPVRAADPQIRSAPALLDIESYNQKIVEAGNKTKLEVSMNGILSEIKESMLPQIPKFCTSGNGKKLANQEAQYVKCVTQKGKENKNFAGTYLSELRNKDAEKFHCTVLAYIEPENLGRKLYKLAYTARNKLKDFSNYAHKCLSNPYIFN